MLDLIRIEIFKLQKRALIWILLLVMFFFFVMYFFGFYFVVVNNPETMSDPNTLQIIALIKTSLQFPDAFNLIFNVANDIGIILLIIMVSAAVGGEYGWNTIKSLLTKEGNRNYYLLSKLITYLIISLLGLFIAVIMGVILASITTQLLAGKVDWSFINFASFTDILRMYGWTLYSLTVYILLSFFAAVIGRSILVGIGVGLGYYFIEAIVVFVFNIAGGSLSKISGYLIGPNVEALLPPNPIGGPFTTHGETLSVLHAFVVLTVYCLVFVSLTVYCFRRRDIR